MNGQMYIYFKGSLLFFSNILSSRPSGIINYRHSPLLERSLTINRNRRSMKNDFLWGTFNFVVLLIVLYDL